jgi:Family of unknown function (DUF6221)
VTAPDAQIAFLNARLDDDEAEAGDLHYDSCARCRPIVFPCDCGYPARVLRDVEAKRAILALHTAIRMRGIDAASCRQCRLTWPCPTLRQVTAVYSDHLAFRAEWST